MKVEVPECDACHRVVDESNGEAIIGFIDFDFCDSVCFKNYRKSALMAVDEVIEEELLRRAGIPRKRKSLPALDWTER